MIVTISGLSPFTEYSCTVFASTVQPGPMSEPTTVRTSEAGIVTQS